MHSPLQTMHLWENTSIYTAWNGACTNFCLTEVEAYIGAILLQMCMRPTYIGGHFCEELKWHIVIVGLCTVYDISHLYLCIVVVNDLIITNSLLFAQYNIIYTYIRIETKLADIARNDLFFLWWNGNTKRMVYDCFLHRIHLKRKTIEIKAPSCIVHTAMFHWILDRNGSYITFVFTLR